MFWPADLGLELLLLFITGKRTLSRSSERDAVSVCVYFDGADARRAAAGEGERPDAGERMTASTCTRTLYVPWRRGMTRDQLETLVREVLDYLARERNVSREAGGAGAQFAYE